MKLGEVRELKMQIEELEGRLTELRELSELPAVKMNGLPSVRRHDSRLASITAKLIDAERELDRLRGELEIKAAELASEIMARVANAARRAVLIKRYVQCKTMRTLARDLGCCLRHAYRLHASGVADFDR